MIYVCGTEVAAPWGGDLGARRRRDRRTDLRISLGRCAYVMAYAFCASYQSAPESPDSLSLCFT